MRLWVREVRKQNGKWIMTTDEGTEVTLGYSVESVVIQFENSTGLPKRIFIRNGEAGIWKHAKKIEYETSPILEDLWAVIHI